MPTVIADRVKVTTTTTGTGTLTLGSAVTGFQDFGVIGDGNETYYTISVPGGADFEVGIGTFTASGTTLSRDTILTSSNGGLAVNLSAGTKDVFVTYPAERSVVSLEGNNSEFPAGTRMIFAQTTAPTGFTKDTSNYNQHALRVVTGTAGTGGTIDFTSAFVSQSVTGTVSTSVTANTGQVVQGGNISVSTGQVIQGGNVSSSGSTGQVVQGGNISVSTGQAAAPGSIGPTAAPIGQAAGPVSVGNTTLNQAQIPQHTHPITGNVTPGPLNLQVKAHANTFSGPQSYINEATNGMFVPAPLSPAGQAHTHPGSGGQHVHPSPAHTHPFTGGQHAHPASGTFTGTQHAHPVSVTSTFTGAQHAHPASGTFTGAQHAHPVSAPATSNFSGTAINLAVKYLDVITATKD
jgi:hypothetical protein